MSTHSARLASQIAAALETLVSAGELSTPIPVSIPLERPRNRDHGDYSSSIALQLAKGSGKSPRQIAELLKRDLERLADVASVEIA
ncbi:MAG: arginine--tRNA ligase, partial [Actinobacteria bacterium]|nr:arginine--tRNA ligase [Actinomycetota bacterium]